LIIAGIATFAVSTVFADSPGHSAGSVQVTGQGGNKEHAERQVEEKKDGGAKGPMTPLSSYPLDYCIVSGTKLDSTGEPIIKTYNGREIRFSSEESRALFEKDQTKYTKKLDEAIVAKEKAGYPLKTCVISGERLEHSALGEPVDFIYNNHLVRLCCTMCLATFKKNPDRYLKKINDAYCAAALSKAAASASNP
jgi:YHS domain-containing protein